MFAKNESVLDRDVRIVLGVLFLVIAAFFLPIGIAQVVAVALAVVMFGTAAFGFCPLYAILGINTRPKKNDR